MESCHFNYSKRIDDALHDVVRDVLMIVSEEGLKDGHHFFISFLTHAPGVQLSPGVKQKYPREITIVVQYQFKDLVVRDKFFSISLSFDGISETVVVPYKAITAFSDPYAKISLQFFYYAQHIDEKIMDEAVGEEVIYPNVVESSNVIHLDKFRKTNNSS